jgi:hypothetical protein
MCQSQEPHYNISELLEACKSGINVEIWRDAKRDAEIYFNLHSKAEIFSFVSGDQIESLKFIKTEALRLEGPKKDVKVDSYEFKTGKIIGYLAFLKATGKWSIKSFKYHHKMKFSDLMDNEKVKNALKAAGVSRKQLHQRSENHDQ